MDASREAARLVSADEFLLERGEEALGDRVVQREAAAAHRDLDAGPGVGSADARRAPVMTALEGRAAGRAARRAGHLRRRFRIPIARGGPRWLTAGCVHADANETGKG